MRWFVGPLLLGLLAVGCAKPHSRPLLQKERVIAAIERLGGRYEVDRDQPDSPLTKVDLAYTHVTDDDLAQLEGLTGLQALNLDGASRISDKGLANLQGLTGLQSLSLAYTSVTDAGLKQLKGLSGLHTLNLWGTRVTDQGAKEFQQKLPEVKVAR
jgi:hypothetical protein